MSEEVLWAVVTRPLVPWSEIEPRIAEHREYQESLVAEGVLLASGPFLDSQHSTSGDGLTILDVANKDLATRIARSDPLVRDGLRDVVIHRWRLNQLRAD